MIQVSDCTKSYGTHVLLRDASFVVSSGERVGLVGRNGSGKSTLFRILAGEERPDSGTVSVPKGYRFGLLRQHLAFSAPTVLAEAESALAPNDDGWVETYRAEAVLQGLGFDPTDLGRPPAELSGGFQVRLHLAKALLDEPDCLLLDEPTNYLDITSLRWLEGFLRAWRGELLLITHDRTFMNAVATHTMALHRQQLRKVAGGTDKVYEQLATEEETYAKTVANDARRRDEAERFINRFRSKATKAKQVQSRVRQLERKGELEALEDLDSLAFRFTPAPFPGKRMLAVEDVTFGWDADAPLFSELSFEIGPRDRIAVIGPNGRGKTTLLELLAGEVEAQSGTVARSPNVRVGAFGQTNVARLDLTLTVEEELASSMVTPSRTGARTLAGRMLFEGDAALKKIEVLSGGERSRVMLGKILAEPSNLLLLDEPTNHLDMESVEALTDAVAAFAGAVVLVTHDEAMLYALADRLVVFDGGTVRVFDGGYAEFLDAVGWQSESAGARPSATQAAEARVDNKPDRTADDKPDRKPDRKPDKKEQRRLRAQETEERRRALGPLQDKVRRLEGEIADLEERLQALHDEIGAAVDDPIGVQDLAHKWAELDARRTHCWDELLARSDELEAAEAEFGRNHLPSG